MKNEELRWGKLSGIDILTSNKHKKPQEEVFRALLLCVI